MIFIQNIVVFAWNEWNNKLLTNITESIKMENTLTYVSLVVSNELFLTKN